MPNLTGDLVQVALIKNDPVITLDYETKTEIEFVTLESWARQFAGFEYSKANPKKKNLIKEHKIFDIPDQGVGGNESAYEYQTIRTTVEVLNNLWRLRYSEYPYFNPSKNDDKGWANHPDPKITWLPSESQLRLLRIYGIEELNEFIIGENVIQLLKDVRNSEWQKRYIQGGEVFIQNDEFLDTIPDY
jgi:hypothetical protein